jgi:DNA-binding transcriptional MerR regulator
MDTATEDGFTIGAVSRLTGIPVHTLRAWERRYGAVTPQRQEGGGRLYSRDDITRLTLLKRLTEAGQAVGTVAQLPLERLRERVGDLSPAAETEATVRRLAVLGSVLPERLRAAPTLEGAELAAVAADREELVAQARAAEADTLVLELATIHGETAAEVLDLLERSGAHLAVVVYAFGPRAAARALDTSRIRPLRSPVTAAEVVRACHGGARRAEPAEGGLVDWALEQPLRPRHYDDAALARLASLSPTMACECPNHMADLVAGLAAFERYSSECESRSPEDAALHYALHAVTGQARALMEDALAYLVAAEGLEDNAGDT